MVKTIPAFANAAGNSRNLFAYPLSHYLALLFHFAIFLVASLFGLSTSLGNLRIFFISRLALLIFLVILVAQSTCTCQQQQPS